MSIYYKLVIYVKKIHSMSCNYYFVIGSNRSATLSYETVIVMLRLTELKKRNDYLEI